LWTREMIRVLLREQFQLRLSLASVGRLLKQLGLTCHPNYAQKTGFGAHL
jgi:transposase